MLIVLFPDQGGDPIQGIEKEMRIYLVSQSIAPTLQTLDAQLLYLLLFFPRCLVKSIDIYPIKVHNRQVTKNWKIKILPMQSVLRVQNEIPKDIVA